MGSLSVAAPNSARVIRKLIAGQEYTYDQATDVIFSGARRAGHFYQRTQVERSVDLCVELTTRCNFVCMNCFSESARGRGGINADAELVADAIIAASPDIIRVCVTGGEPLLHPDVANILDLPAIVLDCGFVLSTNGTARPDLDPPFVHPLRAVGPAGRALHL